MMNTVKKWFRKRGFKSIGLLIAAIAVFTVFGFSLVTAFASGACSALFVNINWQPLKDLSDVDEIVEEKFEKTKDKVEEKGDEIKKLIKEEIDELKRELVGLKK